VGTIPPLFSPKQNNKYMSVYIQGIGNISLQNTFKQDGFPEPVRYSEPYVRCIDPDFREFINPNEARRMSKVIKRAIATAKISISESGITMPDAIISGTGLGCIDDTEKFLSAMIDNDEKFLQPTFFIQSTHNTISSQIALSLKCHGYNNTFVHGGMSFECALADAMLLFADKRIKTALVGGYDEMTPSYFKLLNRVGFWKKEVPDSFDLNKSNTPGSMSGEGSVSVMLSDIKTEKSYAAIHNMEMLYRPESLETSLKTFLLRNGKMTSDIDLVVMGISGDASGDEIYKTMANNLFEEKAQAWYKHLCGEYFTSTGFGFWLAANCIRHKQIPSYAALNNKDGGKLQNVLLVNHYNNKNFSLILFTAC
jgi:3-oxoacyl-(acyl-carrier-protein) synthase